MRGSSVFAIGAAAGTFLLAGCGSSSHPERQLVRTEKGQGAPAPETLQLAADPGGKPEFDVDELRTAASTVEVVLTNPSSVPHDIAVRGNGVDKVGKTVTRGRSSITVTLKPGTYTFYCSVDAHEQQGMKGVLRVGAP